MKVTLYRDEDYKWYLHMPEGSWSRNYLNDVPTRLVIEYNKTLKAHERARAKIEKHIERTDQKMP